jgi:hypothetical protein
MTKTQLPGKYMMNISANKENLAAGVYIARLTAGAVTMNKKITIMKENK